MVAEATTEVRQEMSFSRRFLVRTSTRPRAVTAFLLLAALVCAVCVVAFPGAFSPSIFVPLLVAAGLFLTGRNLARALTGVMIAYAVAAVCTWQTETVHWSVLVVMLAVAAIVLYVARRRTSLPVSLSAGTELLGDLRARLDQQAQVPHLGEEFFVETCVLPAAGAAFSGDFSVAVRRDEAFQAALTDVSGHGPSAGMRALLLSGALSGLLGEVAPADFLPAANRYLIRQGWRDGFASCIHVSLDLTEGIYDVGTAGHPSAAHFHAKTQTWEMVSGAAGLLLGLFELDAGDYSRAQGVLAPGDVLLMYTDGVIEGEHGDIALGTERMLGYADAAIAPGVEGAAQRICAASAADGGHDDRSAVMIWRRPLAEPVADGFATA